ncbi:GxxExxY protein [bacterium]|nr:GxxExxY protein [bacterium]
MALVKEVNEKVYKIIGSCMEVHRVLGPGYPVDFYKKALEVELKEKELTFETEKSLDINYKEIEVGKQTIDFLISGDVVLMIRSQDSLKDIEIQQILRCLAITESSIGVLVNFGNVKIQYKRVLPNYQQKDMRKEPYRSVGYREIGKTREGNPVV